MEKKKKRLRDNGCGLFLKLREFLHHLVEVIPLL
jgi:hypothetical protein